VKSQAHPKVEPDSVLTENSGNQIALERVPTGAEEALDRVAKSPA